MKRIISMLILAAGILPGCKNPEYNCLLTLETQLMRQEQTGTTEEPVVPEIPLPERVVLYSFPVDASEWEVASYEDAFDGVITSLATGETRTYSGYGVNGLDGLILMQITEQPIMLVVCDREEEIYAWRPLVISRGLESLRLLFVLRPYIREETRTELGWTIIYGQTPGPVEPVDDGELQ